MDKQYYLSEGYLTKATPLILELAYKVDGEGVRLLENIFTLVKSTLQKSAKNVFSESEFQEKLYEEHLRRTAEEVVISGYNYGCDEYGILFATIARIKGIPTKYIQCAEVVSYATKKGMNGHVYLECYLNEGTYLVDSTRGTIVKLHSEEDKQKHYFVDTPERKWIMVEAYSGLDSWKAGIQSHEDMIQAFIRVNDEYLQHHSI